MMEFNRFRPKSHFIAPHSWSNDPCGAVYVPETKEYLLCYQWNPGTTEGGNSAWGMARSMDLVTWDDCPVAIQKGPASSYDCLGVFSGSIASRLIDGRRILFLFYTSISALPLHWSKDYIEGCESQSVAFSTDFGRSWHRYESNPLLRVPPKKSFTTGWRDPFISKWESLSELLGVGKSKSYMLIASGERGRGPQLHLYSSDDLLEWKPVSTILDAEDGIKVSPTSELEFGKNFECASFFTLGGKDYLIVGVEEDTSSVRHSNRYNMWLSGKLVMKNESPTFQVSSHGLLDYGILYAAHVFRDAESRLLQLGWADETAKLQIVKRQGWAGCLTHPREIYQISRPIDPKMQEIDLWDFDEQTGMMTTFGIRPAPQIEQLRPKDSSKSIQRLRAIQSTNFEFNATFKHLLGNEKFTFNIRESTNSTEVTQIILDVGGSRITVDRSRSSLANLGENTQDSGTFHLQTGEDLHVRVFVDESIVEIFANDRFALTSRVYPSLESSRGASYEFGDFDENSIDFECWEGLKSAWPGRTASSFITQEIFDLGDIKDLTTSLELGSASRQSSVYA